MKRRTGNFRAALDSDGVLELMVYGDIVDAATISMLENYGAETAGFVSALGVKKALDAGGTFSKIRLRINSPGGDAFEGMAIHSLLTTQAKPVEVYVDGIAASSASIIAMAGTTRTMGRSAMMMIHDAWTMCCGNARDLQAMAATLEKVDESIAAAYMDRTALTAAELRELMDAETWMTAQDCVDRGFATAIAPQAAKEESAAMARARRFASLARLKHVPAALRPEECACPCEACHTGDCSNCSNAECDDANCEDCPMQTDEAAGNQSNLSLFEARAKMLLRPRKYKF